MNSVLPLAAEGHQDARTAAKDAVRELNIQFALLNRQVSARLDFKDVDMGCLDIVNRGEAISPTELARRAGLHPATVTGILDRLERGGWIARDRDPADRRAVLIRGLADRTGEITRLYAGVDTAMDRVCADYSPAELELIAGFLRRAVTAGHDATRELTGG